MADAEVKSGQTSGEGAQAPSAGAAPPAGGAGAGPKVTMPIAEPPPTGFRPILATGGLLALGGGAVYLLNLWRKKQALSDSQGAPLPQGTPAPTPPPVTPTPPPVTPTPPPASGPAPAPKGPDFWGTSMRGQEYRELLARIEQVSRMPIRLLLMVVANRESAWNRKARRKDKVETAASRRAIEAGPERGNPPPAFAASLAEAGSGGLFGALAPYVAWTGLDEGFMPYLNEDYTIVEDPIVAAICAAKYYQRIVAHYETVSPGTPSPEDNYRVRLGWASPKVLKENPAGQLFHDVKRRMDEDLKMLGLSITDLPPPSAAGWPGLSAVVEAMKGFPAAWK